MPMAVLPWTDHPRIRGEHFSWVPIKVAISGSSPHTRGARRWVGLADYRGGGSSPHTRGAQEVCGNYGAEYGIIPAYAGST